MDNNVIEKIDEIMKQNKEFTRDMNVKLNHIRGSLTMKTENVEEAYNRGLQDMWEVVCAIAGSTSKGGLSYSECYDIFGLRSTCDIVDRFTYQEVLDRYKCYKDKKEAEQIKESETFQRGDVVYVKELNANGIFLNDGYYYYQVLMDGNSHVAELTKDVFRLTKTGKHIDLSLD